MSIECYAMVVVPLPMTEEQRVDTALLCRVRREARELDDAIASGLIGHHRAAEAMESLRIAETRVKPIARDVRYDLCRLKLVQSIPKVGAKTVPVPKWKVVEALNTWDINGYMSLKLGGMPVTSKMTWAEYRDVRFRKLFPHLPDDVRFYTETIDDRRVQLRQIRYLFPETMTMSMAVALDYVRDRI